MSIRWAQKRGANLTLVGAVNYLAAALFHATVAGIGGMRTLHANSALIAVGGGLVYAIAFFLLHALMKRRGVAVTAAIMRLSVLVPVGVSLLAWGETADARQTAGIILAVMSLPFLSMVPRTSPAAGEPARPRTPRGVGAALLAGLFAVNGLCLLATRAFRQTGNQGEDAPFLFVLFATAAIVACGVWALQALRRTRVSTAADLRPSTSVLSGLVVGLCNALANGAIVIALQRLPGIIVYPFYSAVGLLVTVLATRLVWKEKLGTMEALGMALAVGSIVLINLS